MNVRIPKPDAGADKANSLTALEIADLSAPKRNTIIYERNIQDLREQISMLAQINKELATTLNQKQELLNSLSLLKRGKVEMYINFIFATTIMAIGGGLISSFPMVNNLIPWQFAIGWSFIFLGVILGVVMRPIIWIIYYRFFHKGKVKR